MARTSAGHDRARRQDGAPGPIFAARVVRGPTPRHGERWGPVAARCPACRDPLLSVLRLPAAAVPGALPMAQADDELVVVTCRNCVAVDFNPYFVRLTPTPAALLADTPAAGFEPVRRVAPISPPPARVEATPAPARMSFLFATTNELTRVGGSPSWVQRPQVVCCPGCRAEMPFVAQFTDPADDTWTADAGLLFAFWCAPCRVMATLSQGV